MRDWRPAVGTVLKREEALDDEGEPMTGARSKFGLERQGMRHLGT